MFDQSVLFMRGDGLWLNKSVDAKPLLSARVPVTVLIVGFARISKKGPFYRSWPDLKNTVSRVLLWPRELCEFCTELGDFCEALGEFALPSKKEAERNPLSSPPGTR